MSLTNGDMKFERPHRFELIDISGVDYGLTTTLLAPRLPADILQGDMDFSGFALLTTFDLSS